MRKVIFYFVVLAAITLIGGYLYRDARPAPVSVANQRPVATTNSASSSTPPPGASSPTTLPEDSLYGSYAGSDPAAVLSAAAAVSARWKTNLSDPSVPSDDEIDGLIRALQKTGQLQPAAALEANDLASQLAKRKQQRLSNLAALERQRVADDVPSRQSYATSAEENYLKNGMDVTVTASGTKRTTLTLKYVLMGRPTVYQLVNDGTFIPTLAAMGFKLVVFTDGYDSSWTFDIQADKFR